MSEYINATYIDDVIGEPMRDALTDNDFDRTLRFIQMASAAVDSALKSAGYVQPRPESANLVDPVLQKATMGGWLRIAYGRKGLEVPAQFDEYLNTLAEIATGRVPVPSLEPTARDAVGGSKFSSTTGDNARPSVFASLRRIF